MRWFKWVAFLALWSMASVVPADEGGDKPKTSTEVTEEVVVDSDSGEESAGWTLEFPAADGLPEEFTDPAFDRYADLKLARTGLLTGDLPVLTDAVLQLIEGERILRRSHKSGLTAKKLARTTAKLAVDANDKESLTRLQQAAEGSRDNELAAELTAAQMLLGKTRSLNPDLSVSLEGTSSDKLLAMKSWLNDSAKATLAGDKELLGKIRLDVEDSDGISSKSRTAFLNHIAQAEKSLGDATEEDRLLQLLAEPNRTVGKLIYSSGSPAPEYGYSWTGHAPQSQAEAIVRAHNEIGNKIDTVANIQQLSTMTKKNVTQNIDTSGSYSKIVASGRVKYDKSESGEAFQQWTRNQNYWMVIVRNVRIKPGSWYSKTEKNWKGERSSKAGGIMLYDFAVYGPNLTEVKAKYTLYNASGKTVNFKMLPSNNSYSLSAGKTFSGNSVGYGKAPEMVILNTNRTYSLTDGNHKFWWMSSENRIGFDKNYK